MRRFILAAAIIVLPGVAWGQDLTPAERQSMENTAASLGYMNASHKRDIPDLHSCARDVGIKNGFAETRSAVADVMLKCSGPRDQFLSDCQQKFSLRICENTAGLLLLHGATVNKPLP